MRFYLDSANAQEIAAVAQDAHVAGITTNPGLLDRAGVKRLGPLLDAVAATGRHDWKLWVQLAEAPYERLLERASQLNDALVERTGGLLAGPTLVFKLLPTTNGLFAASTLIRQGCEVCITAVADPGQALAVTLLPHVTEWQDGRPETEGPPASRNPHMPHSVACYMGRISDGGGDGVKTVLRISDLFVAEGRRTRVLAGSIRDREVFDALVKRMARRPRTVIDATLPFELLEGLLRNPVTAQALRAFDPLGEVPL
jgi:transaldolase